MPKLILINGMPATGKSTLLRQLKQDLKGYKFFSKDDYKEHLYDILGPGDSQHLKDLSIRSIKTGYDYAKRALTKGHNFIYESNFNAKFTALEIQELKASVDFELYQIFLECCPQVAVVRLKQRVQQCLRHPIHLPRDQQINTQLDYLREFKIQALKIPKTLHIQTSHSAVECSKVVNFINS